MSRRCSGSGASFPSWAAVLGMQKNLGLPVTRNQISSHALSGSMCNRIGGRKDMNLSWDPDNPNIAFPPNHPLLNTSDYKMLISICQLPVDLLQRLTPLAVQHAGTHELTITHTQLGDLQHPLVHPFCFTAGEMGSGRDSEQPKVAL